MTSSLDLHPFCCIHFKFKGVSVWAMNVNKSIRAFLTLGRLSTAKLNDENHSDGGDIASTPILLKCLSNTAP